MATLQTTLVVNQHQHHHHRHPHPHHQQTNNRKPNLKVLILQNDNIEHKMNTRDGSFRNNKSLKLSTQQNKS